MPPALSELPVLIRELIEVGEELLDLPLDRHQQPHLLREELHRLAALLDAALVGIHAQVGDHRPGGHLAGRRLRCCLRCTAKLSFQSFQRMALRLPPWSK